MLANLDENFRQYMYSWENAEYTRLKIISIFGKRSLLAAV